MMNIKNCGEGNSGRLLCSDSQLTWKRRSLSKFCSFSEMKMKDSVGFFLIYMA